MIPPIQTAANAPSRDAGAGIMPVPRLTVEPIVRVLAAYHGAIA
jgi:hypothetical protein